MRDVRRALIALALVACGDNDAAVPAPIACVDPCAPFGCDTRDGTCFFECTTAAECATDRVCVDGACVGTECTAGSAEVCAPYGCDRGTCATDCAAAPCATGFYCRGDTHACVPRCTRAGDPVCEGYVCDVTVGECEPYCADGEVACAAGYRCTADQRCVVDDTAPACAAGCGLYACLVPLGRCATHCVDTMECAAGATCVANQCQ
ncbi:MAG TPA: hypothetical protein VFQ53_35375 [Kofleriaceae bacterium]|nr:hypothetical protein [Kofleriaceae bacterium]